MENYNKKKASDTALSAQKSKNPVIKSFYKIISIFFPARIKSLYFYCVTLRSCLSSGIPVSSAFKVLSESIDNQKLKKVSIEISRAIDIGVPIEKIFSEYDNVFPRFFINILVSGFRSGSHIRSLQSLIDHYSFILDLRTEILKVVLYPMIQLFAGALILSAKDTIILSMHSGFKILYALKFLYMYFSGMIIAVLAAYIISRIAKSKPFRPITDYIIHFIPLLSNMYRNYKLAVFFRVCADFNDTGSGLLYGFNMSLDAMDNYYLAPKLKKAEKFIRHGESLFESFRICEVFNNIELSMIQVAEESGSISYLLRKMADYYHTDIKNLMPGLIKITIPVFTVIVALAFFVNLNFFGYGFFLLMILAFLVW